MREPAIRTWHFAAMAVLVTLAAGAGGGALRIAGRIARRPARRRSDGASGRPASPAAEGAP